eukprot:TRINITY_DN512_c0_g1_i1.p1 TRINITY_DN512_c0_g1~~TRINITY_DN512_c0_g1_i1.p1  ORF type:complete len:331 (-),score=140.35 TRINITY_DN512_c0_g1_i1:140-1132(-)
MRPLILKGHERPLTLVKFNQEGDLLFSSSKGTFPCVWNAETGERLGTYNGHTGAQWAFDISRDSTRLITASADRTVKIFDVERGIELKSFNFQTPVRWISFACGDRSFLTVTDNVMNKPANVSIHSFNPSNNDVSLVKTHVFPATTKVIQAHWGSINECFYTIGDNNAVTMHDLQTGASLKEAKEHTKTIQSMQFSRDKTHFITASLDHTAKLYDSKTLTLLKTYEFNRPVNSSSISPILPHALLGGGQAAAEVTLTRVDQSQFRVRLYHKIFEDELASVSGHFGPVNTVTFSPDGRTFVSGGEDGFVRINHLDSSYFSLCEDQFDDNDN